MIGRTVKLVYKEDARESPRALRGKLVSFNDFAMLELPDGKSFAVSRNTILAIKPADMNDRRGYDEEKTKTKKEQR